ncbi:hypothetical protein [Methylobacterium oryzisoli]|uniref:hypothetical protein n=1 Tax=Methylobacterium oryzisoli TaxID=3385502 RepID=UPI00389231AD
MMPSMEDILGAPIERERRVPGTRPGESETVRYVTFHEPRTPSATFREVTRAVTSPLPKRGGAVLEGCLVTLPDGQRLCALSFHGDIEGWQRQIEEGARMLGLVGARLEADVLHLSDGRSVPLDACTIALD